MQTATQSQSNCMYDHDCFLRLSDMIFITLYILYIFLLLCLWIKNEKGALSYILEEITILSETDDDSMYDNDCFQWLSLFMIVACLTTKIYRLSIESVSNESKKYTVCNY